MSPRRVSPGVVSSSVTALLALTVVACSEADNGESYERVETNLYVDSNALWPTMPIPVCWDAPVAGHEQARWVVAEAIAQTWERNSGARFEGWNECTAEDQGV